MPTIHGEIIYMDRDYLPEPCQQSPTPRPPKRRLRALE